jgi:ribonuclease BN (tRNA processing enzyme)
VLLAAALPGHAGRARPRLERGGHRQGRHTIEGFDVLAREIPHPGGRALGYRIGCGPASVAYLTDHSPTSAGAGPDGLGARHEAALALAAGVDVLVHDAQHVAAEFPEQEYLGHACVEYAVALGREAGVGRVVLTHHAPTRTDDELDAIAGSVRGCGLLVVVAAQGLVIELPER